MTLTAALQSTIKPRVVVRRVEFDNWAQRRLFLTPKQAADLHGFPLSHVTRMCRLGFVDPCFEVDGRYFIAPVHLCPPPRFYTHLYPKRPRFPRKMLTATNYAITVLVTYGTALATVQSSATAR